MNICEKHKNCIVMYYTDGICPVCDALSHVEKQDFQVKVGYRYKNRNGLEVDVRENNKANWHPYGEYKGSIDGLDLIEELGHIPLEIKVGKRYVDNDGNIHTLMEKNGNGGFVAFSSFGCGYAVTAFDETGVSVGGGIKLVKEVAE